MNLMHAVFVGTALAASTANAEVARQDAGAELPAGKYDIKATHQGRMLDRSAVLVDRKPMHVGFLWQKAGA